MALIHYILRKLAFFLFSLYIVVTLTFILMKMIPGDPFTQEQAIPEEIMKSMRSYYGLDQPIHIQYFKYLKGVVTWEFGPSFKYEGRTVNDILREGFPISATLGALALGLALFWGVIWGSIAAFFKNRWPDRLAMGIALCGMSLPSFIMATLLQYIFAMQLGICPVARWSSFHHMILPALALSALPSASIARLTRASMIEVLEKDHILTARAKGLSSFLIWKNHVLKNSALPIISYLGNIFVRILTGSFIVETIFGIPGLGKWFVSSISNRDYTIIMGLTVFYSLLLMISMFLIDILYIIIDPRIKGRVSQNGL